MHRLLGTVPQLLVGRHFYVFMTTATRLPVFTDAMKKHVLCLLQVCAAAIIFAGCATSRHSTQWDYKIVYGPGGLEQQVRKAAGDGWEVVSSGGGDASPFVILRKSK